MILPRWGNSGPDAGGEENRKMLAPVVVARPFTLLSPRLVTVSTGVHFVNRFSWPKNGPPAGVAEVHTRTGRQQETAVFSLPAHQVV